MITYNNILFRENLGLYLSPPDVSFDNFDNEEPPLYFIGRRRSIPIMIEQPELKEIQSNNENFIKEKDMKFHLYPLYINWTKIESKSLDNNYFNIFKLFGYFGVAIYEILIESCSKIEERNYYTHNKFIHELNKLYKKEYGKEEIEQTNFYKKLIDIKEDIISLINNKIVIFKEISIFFIILKFYQSIYISLNDKNNAIDSLKHQFALLSYLKDDEYEMIYNKYLKKVRAGRYLGVNIFKKNKEEYVKQIKSFYKIYK